MSLLTSLVVAFALWLMLTLGTDWALGERLFWFVCLMIVWVTSTNLLGALSEGGDDDGKG